MSEYRNENLIQCIQCIVYGIHAKKAQVHQEQMKMFNILVYYAPGLEPVENFLTQPNRQPVAQISIGRPVDLLLFI